MPDSLPLSAILADVALVERRIEAGMPVPITLIEDMACHIKALAAETDELRAIIRSPREMLFADGREPTRNERHLLNLLSWRQQDNEHWKRLCAEYKELAEARGEALDLVRRDK